MSQVSKNFEIILEMDLKPVFNLFLNTNFP